MLDFYITPMFMAFVPLVVGAVAVLKVYVNSYYAPLLSIGVGMVVSIIATEAPWGETIINGLAIGLLASGLYSGGKTLLQPIVR